MSKVSRADWSAQVPASGIIGRLTPDQVPAIGGGGKVDVGALGGTGFSIGQVPVWDGVKFIPYTLPPSGTSGGVTSQFVNVEWSGQVLRPLESAQVLVYGTDINSTKRAIVQPNVPMDYVSFLADISNFSAVTITATNLSGSDITLPDGQYQLWIL